MTAARVDAVVFDLDGVLIDSEHVWEQAWTTCAADVGYAWTARDTAAAQGMSAPEWAALIADRVGGRAGPEQVRATCTDYFIARILAGDAGSLLPGARAMVSTAHANTAVALASSAPRRVIDAILEHHDLSGAFDATVSSEEVARGKPSPDVYLEAVRRLDCSPDRCFAVEDSTNGIRSACAAGLRVIAVPNPTYRPAVDALSAAVFVAVDAPDVDRYLTAAFAGALQ